MGTSRNGVLALLIVSFLSACSPPADPRQVATEFWQAQLHGDADRTRHLVRESDAAKLDSGLTVLPIRAFELGRLRLDGDRAELDTRVTLAGDDALHVDVVTLLIREQDAWRVNYPDTVRDITTDSRLGKLITRVQELATRLGAGVNQSLEELKRALPKLESELSTIEKDIRGQVPELRRRLDELLRDLPQARPTPPASPDRRAI